MSILIVEKNVEEHQMKKKIYSLALICIMMITVIPTEIMAKTKKNDYWPEGPQVQSEAAIVMELSTGTILYEKNKNDKHYPASITKILTTLLAVENSKMDEVVTFSHDAVFNTEGSGIARDVGEEMTMEQCLYGVMLASANECAYAVAEHVAGDIGSFVQMMNDRAKKIGCKNTHFNNCNGLPDETHYTSAYDMALIAREAYKNEMFRMICGTKTYTIPVTNKHPDEETYLQNHHQMLYPYKSREYLYEYCLGGKTGYTMAANSTLVTFAEKDGMTLVCVVMDVDAPNQYYDTRGLFDFCFDNYKKVSIEEYENETGSGEQENSNYMGQYEGFVELEEDSVIVLPVAAELKDVERKVVYDETDEDVLGMISYKYANHKVGQAAIVRTNEKIVPFEFQSDVLETETEISGDTHKKMLQIDMKWLLYILLGIVAVAVGVLLFITIMNQIYKIRRKRKMNRRMKSPYKKIKVNKSYRMRKRR